MSSKISDKLEAIHYEKFSSESSKILMDLIEKLNKKIMLQKGIFPEDINAIKDLENVFTQIIQQFKSLDAKEMLTMQVAMVRFTQLREYAFTVFSIQKPVEDIMNIKI